MAAEDLSLDRFVTLVTACRRGAALAGGPMRGDLPIAFREYDAARANATAELAIAPPEWHRATRRVLAYDAGTLGHAVAVADSGAGGGGDAIAGENRRFSAELAIAFGELGRMADATALATRSQFANVAATPDQISRSTPDSVSRVAQLPTSLVADAASMAVVVGDAIRRERGRSASERANALPMPLLLRVIEDLSALQDAVAWAPYRRDGVEHRPPVHRSVLARDATLLAGAEFLALDRLPDAFQAGYDRAWHTDAKTRTPTGGFVGALRDRAAREGGPELLTVLAASSDGRNRAAAGLAARTPPAVYDKLIYDNSKGVLVDGVVESAQFTQNHAWAMLETELAKQTTAVMLGSRMEMSIRTIAARRAIAHDGVDPLDIYDFLGSHTTHPEVPHALWRDFIFETQRRLTAVRVHGTPRDAGKVEGRLRQLTARFMSEMLKPYREAKRRIEEASTGERSRAGAIELYRRRTHGRGLLPADDHGVSEHQRFLEAHDFVRDPDLRDVMLEGVPDEAALVTMLQLIVESGIPVSKKMLVKVFTHDNQAVRQAGRDLLPNVDPDEVARLALEVDARVTADYDAIRDHVHTVVIPDYEEIDGTARHLGRMHHYFPAAKELSASELVAIYVQCATTDPRRTPDAFRDATMARRYAARALHALAGGQQDERPSGIDAWITGDRASQPRLVKQGDLFGAGPAASAR